MGWFGVVIVVFTTLFSMSLGDHLRSLKIAPFYTVYQVNQKNPPYNFC